MTSEKTIGLIAAPPTGFTENGQVDLAAVEPLARHLERDGVAGAFVNGTTGEGMALSLNERKELAAQWRRAIPRTMKLFIHVGYANLEDSMLLAQHAVEIDADAVSSTLPASMTSGDVPAAVDWCAQIANSANERPFYLYHIPSMTGVDLPVARFLEQAVDRIPNLAGVKYTHFALDDYFECLRLANARFDVLWGRDETLLGALAMGAQGAVGSTYNTDAPLYRELIDAFQRGDLESARDLQARANAMIRDLLASESIFRAVKDRLRNQGVPIRPDTRPNR